MWWPVNERNNKAGPLDNGSMTSNVSQLNKISADSLPVLYFDLSSAVLSTIDFDNQIVGDDVCSSFIATTCMENKSLNQIISPDSSSRNLIPFSPRETELKSKDSVI